MKSIQLCVLIAFIPFLVKAQQDTTAGETLFKARCTACHNVAVKLVGPALKDVDKRRSLAWIAAFVHSSQAVIKSGDAAAVTLFNENNQVVMPDQPDLKDNDILNIVSYIKKESIKIPTTDAHDGIKRPDETKGSNRPIVGKHYEIWVVLGLSIVVLIYAFNWMINAVSAMHQYKEENG